MTQQYRIGYIFYILLFKKNAKRLFFKTIKLVYSYLYK